MINFYLTVGLIWYRVVLVRQPNYSVEPGSQRQKVLGFRYFH